MRTRLASWLVLAIMHGAAGPVALAVDADFYVATDGNDQWSGRLASANADGTDGPFATVNRARDAVRSARTQTAKPWTVLVRGGVYRLAEPIVFTPQDSGAADAVVTYAAYPGEKPVLSGGRAIKGWKPDNGDIWSTQVREDEIPYFYQLFVNSRRCTRARTPNDGYLRTEGPLPGIENPQQERQNPEAKMGFRFKPGDLKQWDNLEDVNVFSYQSWTAALNWIAALDESNGIVKFTAPANWPLGYWERKQRYHVENYAEALDAPGEWYLDRKTRILRYWPMEAQDMTSAVVEAPVLRKLVRFDGDYQQGRFVEHIRLQGLSFQHATWYVKDKGPADGQAAAWLEAAIFAQGARHCTIENCEIAHVGEYGLYLEQGCQHNRVLRCHIHDLGAGGVRIGYMNTPSDDNAAAEHNVIDNCIIHDGGHVFRAGVGVWIGRSSHNTVAKNVICDFDYTGISVGWSWGYAPTSAHHNVIEYNHVYNIGRGVLSDMGGIYTLGVSPGTVVRNNIFHDVYSYAYGGWGLYTDEGSTDILLENNIVYNTKTGGFHQHYGKENVIRNNILAFSREGQVQRSREEEHLSFTFERNIVYFDDADLFSGRWTNGNYRMNNNVYWDVANPDMDFAGMTFDRWQRKGFDTNSIVANPKFVNPDARDFRLEPDSPALEIGFKPIDTSEVGVYGPQDWTHLAKTIEHKPFVFPKPAPPEPIEDGFEQTSVGSCAANAVTSGESDTATIRVTDEKAFGGQRSLKFIDQPGLEHAFNPHLFYQPGMRKGATTVRFALYREPGATLYHEWRDSRSPYRVGPSLWFTQQDQLLVANKPVTQIPAGKWVQFEIVCGLGRQANGTFDLIVTIAGQDPKRFEKLPCSHPQFNTLNWCGFVTHEQSKSIFYLDDVIIQSAGE